MLDITYVTQSTIKLSTNECLLTFDTHGGTVLFAHDISDSAVYKLRNVYVTEDDCLLGRGAV
jgi:hypothetical protein